MAIHSIRSSGGEPSTWKPQLFANVGGNEEFVMQIAIEMPELVEATVIHGEQREKLNEAIEAVVLDGLLPAFEQLKTIRSSAGQKMAELNRKMPYENFSGSLWHAYKDLMQKAAKMMDPEMGFLFQKDTQFESGLASWCEKHPEIGPEVTVYLRSQRSEWQNELCEFRNYLEHTDDRDPSVFAKRYDLAHAEHLFERVWRAIAEILAMLVNLRLPKGTQLVEIPPEQRNKHIPRRFGYWVQGIPPVQAS